MTHLPGYAGYRRSFDREYVTHAPIPASKYQDLQLVNHKLSASDPWRSVYASSMNRDTLADYWNKQEDNMRQQHYQQQSSSPSADHIRSASAPSSFASSTTSSSSSSSLSSSPSSSSSLPWSSSYRDSYRSSASSTSELNSLYTQPVSLPQVLSSTPFAHNLLRNQPNVNTSYTREYGKRGTYPLQRTSLANGFPQDKAITAMSTSKDLFEGTAKDSIRVSGYTGFVPASHNNRHTIQGDVYHHKDNLLQIHRHDMCNYGGHQPRCVSNDRGPRTPRGKRRMNEGLVASLILDSMKV